MRNCLNCNFDFSGNYCNNCGQKKIEGTLSIKHVFTDFTKVIFLFDTTLYHTLKEMLLRPGKLSRAFLEGKQKSYLSPFQFFLLFMTIHLIVLNYFGESIFSSINNELQLKGDDISNVELIQSYVRKNLNVLYFILTPIIALSIKLFYRKIKYNYSEILIFSFYIMGVSFFLSSIIILISQIEAKLFILKSMIMLVYFPFAIIKFTQSKSIIGIVKSFLTVILSYFLFALAILLIFSLYVYA
ncbi:MAG: DUF3667 domain-containing protein [Flavobacteriales bacterium]|nr:DUF3667 domain-containing protein [Flavobacteriales bacterium]